MGGGWLETDNRAISVQLNLTGTATGTELGNKHRICLCKGNIYRAHSLLVFDVLNSFNFEIFEKACKSYKHKLCAQVAQNEMKKRIN